MKFTYLFILISICSSLDLTAQWIGQEFSSPGTTYTKFQFAEHTWSGSHAILFNAYKSVTVNGSLLSTGNTKFANSSGGYSSGAGGIIFNGNGGGVHVVISPTSTGANNPIDWGGTKLTIARNGNVGVGTSSPSSWFSGKTLELVSNRPILKLTSEDEIGTIYLTNSDVASDHYGEFHLNHFYSSSNPNASQFRIASYPGGSILNVQCDAKVGINTMNPTSDLDVNGEVNAKRFLLPGTKFANGNDWDTNTHSHLLDRTFIYTEGSRRGFFFSAYGSNADIRFQTGGNWSNLPDKSMILTTSGDVGIGTISPTEKLSVNGTIRSKEVKVEASPWPDYVFSPDYRLPTIDSLANFIQSHNHLPEVPTAAEVEEEGIALGEMNAILLKKIEEHSLYIIELHKEVKELKEETKELRIENEELKMRIGN